jgi:hypothetical protein
MPSGAFRADFLPILERLSGAFAWLTCASLLACSAYENTTTPGHAIGSTVPSNPNGQGGTQGDGAGGTLGQSGSTSSSSAGTSSGIAGSLSGVAGSSTIGQGGGASGSSGAASPGGSGGAGGNASGGNASSGAGGGSGGGGSATCSAHPLTPKSMWTVTASNSSAGDVPAHAIDGDLTTRWSSGKDQAGDEWLQLDFGADVTVTTVTLELGTNANDYPRTYKTRLTDTANNLAATPQLMGSGAAGVDTAMKFDAPTTGRYLLITQGGMATGLWWSVAEFSAQCSD